MSSINIFDYFDYREYLTVYYKIMKRENPKFSHRSFLAKADIPGTVFLQRIMTGQRKISSKYIPNLVRALQLKKREANYFSIMIKFLDEKDPTQKQEHLRELMRLRQKVEKYRIDDKRLNFFSKWYYPIIRELIVTNIFNDNFGSMASVIVPPITSKQAEDGVKYLIESGFVEIGKDGRYRLTNANITSGAEVSSVIVAGYHKTNLDMSKDAIDTISREKRDISSLTLTVTPEELTIIKREIKEFRSHLMNLVGATPKDSPKLVCHVGFQLLPKSDIIGEG